MKINWKTRSLAALIGFLGALGGMGVMVTGLRFDGFVPMGPVAVWCLLVSLSAALMAGRKGAFLLPLGLGVLTLWGWKALELNRSVEALLYYISFLYRSGYGWPLIRWSREPLTYDTAALAFCVLGAWLSMAVSFGYLNRGGVWLGAFAAALPLLPCLVLTDTVPQEKWLFLQLLSLLLLLFCSRVPKRGLYLTLPVALALGGMFLLMPQETYKGQNAAERMWEWLEEKFSQEDPEGAQEVPVWVPDLEAAQVNLNNAGPRPRWLVPVMKVTAQETGTLYLRSLAFDGYTGTRWQLDEEDNRFPFFYTEGVQNKLTVETLAVHETLYLPYGAQTVFKGHQVLEDNVLGQVENVFQATAYDIFYKAPDLSLVSQWETRTGGLSGLSASDAALFAPEQEYITVIQVQTPWARYLELPEETRTRAEAWLKAHLPEQSGSPWERAKKICDLVRRSAGYDLSTQRMPVGEDFAMWFLEESETGYCVHFASAAAVLLRAAGIPSRYVSGYVAQTVAGQEVTVYQKNAHAWVEVYVHGAGWVMLEPTPGEGMEDILSETVPNQETTEPTEPEETTEPTETAEPTEATKPAEITTAPTVPSQTSPIGGADKPARPGTVTEKKPLPGWVKGLLWTLLGFAVLISQWRLRLYLRRQRRKRGNPNRQMLTLWRDAVLCAWLLGQKPPEEFRQLALKAKFSQHTVTPQERALAAQMLHTLQTRLNQAPLWRKALGFLLAII